MGDAIIVIDQGGVIKEWNADTEKLLGFTEKEAIGEQVAELIIPERFRARHRAALSAIIGGADPRLAGQTLNLFSLTKRGVEIPVQIHLDAVHGRGGWQFTATLKRGTGYTSPFRGGSNMRGESYGQNGGLPRFIRAHSGAVAVAALLAAGGMGALWVSGIISLPEQMTLEQDQRKAADVLIHERLEAVERLSATSNERLVWVICTTIPPNTRNELRALRVECGEVDAIMGNLR